VAILTYYCDLPILCTETKTTPLHLHGADTIRKTASHEKAAVDLNGAGASSTA
jgi:hypothetical protein